MEWNKAVHCVWCRITSYLYSWHSALAESEHLPQKQPNKTLLIPLGFKSSFGYKPSGSSLLLGHFMKDLHRLSWEPMKLNHRARVKPFQGHLDWLPCKLTHITYSECMKWLHNSQCNFGAVKVSFICFHQYNMGWVTPPIFSLELSKKQR